MAVGSPRPRTELLLFWHNLPLFRRILHRFRRQHRRSTSPPCSPSPCHHLHQLCRRWKALPPSAPMIPLPSTRISWNCCDEERTWWMDRSPMKGSTLGLQATLISAPPLERGVSLQRLTRVAAWDGIAISHRMGRMGRTQTRAGIVEAV